MWIVYMIVCGDGTLYTGITKDVKRRMAEHEQGKGAKYTKGRGPFRLVYAEEGFTKNQALRREAEIKSMKRPRKFWLLSECPPEGYLPGRL